MLQRVVVAVIRAYQWVLRPLLPPTCRFHPTCSDYALDAVRQHGAFRGAFLALRRILRCHPWHPGGYDPVLPGSAAAASARPRAGAAGR